jgi:molybdopterin converting factor small subunit
MRVKVRSVGQVRQLLGQGELELSVPDGTTVMGLLRILAEEHSERMAPFAVEPKDPRGHLPVRVMVNEQDSEALDGRFTVLQPEDDVLIFLPIAGG